MMNIPVYSGSGLLAPGIYIDEIDRGSMDIPDVTRDRVRALLKHLCDKKLASFIYEENSIKIRARLRAALRENLVAWWVKNQLKGESAEEAFFIRWDYAMMTETDLDNWFLICTVGIAPVKPSEFVVYRILLRFAAGPLATR